MIRELAFCRDGGRAGEDLGWQGGSLYLAGLVQLSTSFAWLRLQKRTPRQPHVERLRDGPGPAIRGVRWAGAMYTGATAREPPCDGPPSLAAQTRGCALVSACAVRGIDRAAGRVAARSPKGVVAPAVVSRVVHVRDFCGRRIGPQLWCASVARQRRRIRCSMARPGALRRDSTKCGRRLTVAHGALPQSIRPPTIRSPQVPPAWTGHGSTRLASAGSFSAQSDTQPVVSDAESRSSISVLEPAPEPKCPRSVRAALQRVPRLASAPFVETWGGMTRPRPMCGPCFASRTRRL